MHEIRILLLLVVESVEWVAEKAWEYAKKNNEKGPTIFALRWQLPFVYSNTCPKFYCSDFFLCKMLGKTKGFQGSCACWGMPAEISSLSERLDIWEFGTKHKPSCTFCCCWQYCIKKCLSFCFSSLLITRMLVEAGFRVTVLCITPLDLATFVFTVGFWGLWNLAFIQIISKKWRKMSYCRTVFTSALRKTSSSLFLGERVREEENV